MDVGVGEASARNANRGSTARCTHGVISPSATDTQGGALLTKVPPDTGEKLDAAAKAEEAHGYGYSTPALEVRSSQLSGLFSLNALTSFSMSS